MVAAVLAPITAHYRQKRALVAESDRQRRALEAESERQQRALRAESDRQSRQLAHDRLLRDLEEVQTRLDDVIDMGEAALSAVCAARLAFNADEQKSCDDQLWQARDCLGQYGYKERRVRLRVGADHSLIGGLTEYRNACPARCLEHRNG